MCPRCAIIPSWCAAAGGVFLGGPPLVKAATGEDVSADELGGADVHSTISGTADYAVDNEQEGIALVREIVGTFPRPVKARLNVVSPRSPTTIRRNFTALSRMTSKSSST